MELLSRIWFGFISFVSGMGTTSRVLAILLPFTGPVTLLVSVFMGIRNAKSQSDKLTQRTQKIAELKQALADNEPTLQQLHETYASLHAHYHARDKANQEGALAIEAWQVVNMRLKLYLTALQARLWRLQKADAEQAQALMQQVNAVIKPGLAHWQANLASESADPHVSMLVIEDIIDQLNAFVSEEELAAVAKQQPQLIRAEAQLQKQVAKANKRVKQEQAQEPEKLGLWQRIKAGAGKFWSVASVGIGSFIIAYALMHVLAAFFAGIPLIASLSVAATVGVGAMFLHVVHQEPLNKELQQLTQQNAQLQQNIEKVQGKIKRVEHKIERTEAPAISIKEGLDYHLAEAVNTLQQFERDFKVSSQPRPKLTVQQSLQAASHRQAPLLHKAVAPPAAKALDLSTDDDDFIRRYLNLPEAQKEAYRANLLASQPIQFQHRPRAVAAPCA